MGPVERSKASLRIGGDDLDPDEITALLGCSPSFARTKGKPIKAGSDFPSPSGGWNLHATQASPEDLDSQIAELLGMLTEDIQVWAEIGRRFNLDLFCGLFMSQDNQGLTISVASLDALSRRGIQLSLDIYAP